MTVQELLLKALDDLRKEDFERFKWFLLLESNGRILKSHLENKSRIETVSKVLSICNDESEAVDMTVKTLKKIGNNNAAEKLKKAYAGISAASTTSAALAPPPAPASIMAQQGGWVVAPTITGNQCQNLNITIKKP